MHLIVYYCIIESQTASHTHPPDKSAQWKISLLFLNQNICCGYLNGPIK